jgi:hypothetical protein
MAIKNFVVKNGLTVGNSTLDAASGNLVVSNANLGNLATANFFNGNANALFNIQGGNVVGIVANANNSAFAGVVTTASQPNITSVGTLSSLTVTGNTAVGGLLTDNYYYANGSPVDFQQAAGTNTQIQYNLDGDFGASANFTFNPTSNTLTVLGNANVTTLNTTNIDSGIGNLVVTVNGNAVNFYGNGVVAFPSSVTAPTFIGNVQGNISGNITVTGSNTGVVFNDDGLANSTLGFTFDKASNAVTANGNLTVNNAALGNLATANYVNVANDLTVTGNGSAANFNAGNLLTANFVTGTLTTASQPNITTVGTLGSLSVTGNIGAGNIDGGNLVTANFVTGTLTTAAQPNITSVGNLSSLVVTGNVDVSANINVDTVAGKTGSLNLIATGDDNSVFLKPTGTGTVDVWDKIISNVALPVNATDAATKGYVDSVAEGLHVHASVAAATPDTLANISSGTVTYDNGTAGIGATLTTTGTYATIDGVNIATVGTRILVKNETNKAHNGIYVFTSSTVLTRATDYDTAAEIQGGDFTFVTGGTLYNSTGWVQIDEVTIIGTDPIEWEQFSGAGTYLAGTGLTLTGDTFSISNTTVTAASYGSGDAVATFTVNAQGQLTAASNVAIAANAANLTGTTLSSNILTSSLTSVGTLGSLSVTGNVSAGNVSATDISGTTLGGTLTTAAQPNITSVGTLSSLSVTGNANVGNIGATAGVFTGNVSSGNLSTIGELSVTGNANVGNLGTAGLVVAIGNVTGGNLNTSGVLSVTGNANVGNLGTAGLVVATGNVTGGNLTTAGIVSATGNVSGGNLTTIGVVSATGNVTGGNLTTGGVLSVTGNANVGNIGATAGEFTGNITSLNANLGNLALANFFQGDGGLLTNVTASGTLANGTSSVTIPEANGNVNTSVGGVANVFVVTTTGANVTGTLNASGNANVGNLGTAGLITATGNITGGNLSTGGALSVTGNITSGNANLGNLATANFFTGTLTTNAQPNITSVGTLTGLDVNGNITAVNITANTGIFTGNAAGLTNIPAGNINGQVANALVAGTVYTNAQPNITSVGTLTSLDVTGNIGAGNVNAGNLLTANFVAGTLTTAAQPNVTSVGTLTSLDTSGNVTVGGNLKLQVGITSNRANVAISNSPTVIDQFSPTSWRTAKYVISASGDDGYQSTELLLVHDGLDSYVTIYGVICSNAESDLISISSNINGVTGNVTVYATSDSDNCYVNLVSSYIKT